MDPCCFFLHHPHPVRLFLLGRGDKIRLSTGEVLPDPTKDPLEVEGAFHEPLEADPFARWALLHLLGEFGTAVDQELTLRRAQHLMKFQKEPGFRALAWEGLGIQDTPLGLFMGPFVLRVSRE